MKQKLYVLLAFLQFGVSAGYAQIEELDELRQKPDSNSLKVAPPELELRPVTLSLSDLDLKVIYWKHWSTFGINLNQASFSENWNGGGVNSIAVLGLIDHKSEYNRNNTNFTTQIRLEYGKQKNRDQLPRKNNDRIFWDNKLSVRIAKSWSLFTSLTFESQFDIGNSFGKDSDGRDSITGIISNFMAPGYLTESFGLEYKPDNTFSVRFGTGTARQTFVYDDRIPLNNDGTRFGVEEGKHMKNDLAFQLTALLDRNIGPNLNLKSRYNMFANYEEISDPAHNLEATLTASVTRLINVTLRGILIYDSRQAPDVQTSQTLALGLQLKLPR